MLKNLRKKTEGFTIIEVLIVLAIAGLILLIVFLAVPALQRNSRNTQRRSDIGRVGGAAQEVLNNNNGRITSLTSANIQTAVGTLGYYTAVNVTVAGVAPTAATNTSTIDTVQVYHGAVCADIGSGGRGATATGATVRSVAVVFKVEPDNNSSRVCQEL